MISSDLPFKDDVRWHFGVPPKGNANFASVQHFIHQLAPQGMASFVLANGSMSLNQSGESDNRHARIGVDLVDNVVRNSAIPQGEATPQVMTAAKNNMVALPAMLFYRTQIPVSLVPREKQSRRRQMRLPRPPQTNPLHRRPQTWHPHRPLPPRAELLDDNTSHTKLRE